MIARIRGVAAAHAPVDMSELLSSFTNDILCRAMAGRSFRVEGRNKVFRELIDAGMAIVGGFNLENFYPRLAKVAGGVLTWPARQSAERLRHRWDNIFDALIDEHAREMAGADGGGDLQESDFIHVLLCVQEEYGLTRNNIKGILAVSSPNAYTLFLLNFLESRICHLKCLQMVNLCVCVSDLEMNNRICLQRALTQDIWSSSLPWLSSCCIKMLWPSYKPR